MKSFYLKNFKVYVTNFGPQHLAAHGVLRIIPLVLYGFVLVILLNTFKDLQHIASPVEEIIEVANVINDPPCVTGNIEAVATEVKPWSSYIVKSLAITITIVVAGPAFFPLLSTTIVGMGCGLTKLLFTKAALPIMCLPAIIDQAAIELIAAEIPAVVTTLSIMDCQLLQIED